MEPPVTGHVPQAVVGLRPCTPHGFQGTLFPGVLEDGLIEKVDIRNRDPLEIGIGNDGGRVGTDHAIAVPGAGPLRQPAAFPVCVGQAGHDPGIDIGVHQREEGKDGTERIPEPVIRIKVARTDLPVEGAVVDHLSLGVDLVELARKEKDTVEAGVEGLLLILCPPLHPDPPQFPVPALLGRKTQLFEGLRPLFPLQVQPGLLRTDKGRGHPDRHHPLLTGVKTEDRPHMFPFRFRSIHPGPVGPGLDRTYGAIETHDKGVGKPLGHPPAVLSGIPFNPCPAGIHPDA